MLRISKPSEINWHYETATRAAFWPSLWFPIAESHSYNIVLKVFFIFRLVVVRIGFFLPPNIIPSREKNVFRRCRVIQAKPSFRSKVMFLRKRAFQWLESSRTWSAQQRAEARWRGERPCTAQARWPESRTRAAKCESAFGGRNCWTRHWWATAIWPQQLQTRF